MIKPIFWNGETSRAMRGNKNAQVLTFYVMTCMHSRMTGIYHVAVSTIVRETGLTLDEVTSAIRDLTELGFIKYDVSEEIMWVKNLALHQVGDSLKPGDKQRAGILANLKDFSGHPYVTEFFEKYGSCYGVSQAPSQGAIQGSLIPDPCSLISDPDTKSKQRAKKSKAMVTIPDDWSVEGKLLAWCQEKRVSERDIKTQTERFRADAEKNGKEFKDWNAAFRTWVLNAIEWGHVTPLPPSKASLPKEISKTPSTQRVPESINQGALDSILDGSFFERK